MLQDRFSSCRSRGNDRPYLVYETERDVPDLWHEPSLNLEQL